MHTASSAFILKRIVEDKQTGISIRFIRQFDAERAQRVTGADVFMHLFARDLLERSALEHLFALPSPPEGPRA